MADRYGAVQQGGRQGEVGVQFHADQPGQGQDAQLERKKKEFLKKKVRGTDGWCAWSCIYLIGAVIFICVNLSGLDADSNAKIFIGATYAFIAFGSYIFSMSVREYEREKDKDENGLRGKDDIEVSWPTFYLRLFASSVIFAGSIIVFIVSVAVAKRVLDNGDRAGLTGDGIRSCVATGFLILGASMKFMNMVHNRSDFRSFARL